MTMKLSLLGSPDMRQAILDAVREGISVRSALLSIGFSEMVIKDWQRTVAAGTWRGSETPCAPEKLEIMRDFLEQLNQARHEHVANMVRVLNRAANSVNEKTGIPEWRAALAMLTNSPFSRGEWHQYRPEEAQPVVEEAQSLRQLSDDEVISLAGDEWREVLTLPGVETP